MNVLPKNADRTRMLQYSGFDHQACATWQPFFTRLKNTLDRALPFLAKFVQDARGAQQR